MIRTLAVATLALLLGGCAAFNNIDNEVSTYGAWPAGRQPAGFVFERLPSQQARPQRQQVLEDAARAALEAAGFTSVADASDAQYLLQLSARVAIDDPWYDLDTMYWRGGLGYGPGFGPVYGRGAGYRHGRWGRGPWGPGWDPGYGTSARFEREVALLIRDHNTGELLYEARASNSGPSATLDRLLPPMFRAALRDFPASNPEPHVVTVPLSPP